MKRKVKMTCVLKSGTKVEETIRIDKKNSRAFEVINRMRTEIEESLGYAAPKLTNITFGQTTVLVSEIAAVSFKEV
jgi:hypothetical protein